MAQNKPKHGKIPFPPRCAAPEELFFKLGGALGPGGGKGSSGFFLVAGKMPSQQSSTKKRGLLVPSNTVLLHFTQQQFHECSLFYVLFLFPCRRQPAELYSVLRAQVCDMGLGICSRMELTPHAFPCSPELNPHLSPTFAPADLPSKDFFPIFTFFSFF